MNRCIIVCAAPEPRGFIFDHSPDDLIICADGGLSYAHLFGLTPQIAIGDFDSYDGEAPNCEIIRAAPEKDDTDTLMAIKEGLVRGYGDFILLNALGGRLDHTIANIQCLSYLIDLGSSGTILDAAHTVRMIRDSRITLPRRNAHLSIFAYGGMCEGVTITGVKYPLIDGALSPGFPLGISNEYLGAYARISIAKGTLLIIESE